MTKATSLPIPLALRIVGRILFSVIVILAVFWLIVFVLQRKFLFPREAAVQDPGAMSRVRGLVQIWIDTPEGKVEGWFLPAPGASAQRPAPVVIFAHGNAELIDQQAGDLEAYRAMGVSVLLPEFRGYGRSAGSPTQEAITLDFLAFHYWLLERDDVDPARIIYHGRSLGGGAVFALAAKHPPAAMILESTFESARARMKSFGIPGFLCRDPFDNITVIRNLECPILLFHGRNDTIIPHADSVALQAAAKKATLISLDCGHNDLPPDVEAYWEQIESFLRSVDVVR